jgi:hypothetical protein
MRLMPAGGDWLLVDVPGDLADPVAHLPYARGAAPVEDDELCVLVAPSEQAADLLRAAHAAGQLRTDPAGWIRAAGALCRYLPLALTLGGTAGMFHVTVVCADHRDVASSIRPGFWSRSDPQDPEDPRICRFAALDELLRLHDDGVLWDPAGLLTAPAGACPHGRWRLFTRLGRTWQGPATTLLPIVDVLVSEAPAEFCCQACRPVLTRAAAAI